MGLFERDLVIVDIETNGASYQSGQVIEVAAIRVSGGEVVSQYQTLVDPGKRLPYFITNLTGITDADLQGQPVFADIAKSLHNFCKDAIFVAHNVRFDYSFLKQEFARCGISFSPLLLCSVRLSRALYPEHRKHSLATIIERRNIAVDARHRAYDDARAVYDFFKIIESEHQLEAIESALKLQLRHQSLPRHISEDLVAGLPEGPGVYIFEDDAGSPIYIGKSVNIKKRVMSHFSRDHAQTNEFKIAQHVRDISYHQTHGELGALILESDLIKRLMPLYNKKLRRSSKLLIARTSITESGHKAISLESVDELIPEELSQILAVFPNRSKAKQSLELARATFQLCPKLLGLEKSKGACFWSQLGKCRGACANDEPAAAYNARLELAFNTLRLHAWPYKQPILIEETSELRQGSSAIVIDQWRVVAQIEQDEYVSPKVTILNQAFELDTYKILQSYLKKYANSLRITLLDTRQLGLLLQDSL